jgi:O-antigen/teichoic acid export membrane protein
MERSAIANMAKDIVLLFSVYGVIFFKGHLLHLIWASLFAHLVNFGFNFFLMRDVMRGSLTPRDLTLWREVIRSALPLGLAYLAVTLYAGIDTVLLDRMVGESAVGYYNAAYKFIYQAIVLPIAFVNSLFPFMSEYWHRDQEKLKILFQKAYDAMVLIAIPFGVTVTITAPKLILLIYGNPYTPSILPLQILIWAVVLMFQTIIFGYMMVALDQQRKSLVIDLCALGLNIGLNLILIPLWSFIGASITTVVTELFVLIPTIYIIQERLNFSLSLGKLPKSFLISGLCALLLILSDSLHLFIQLGISIAGCGFFTYVFKLVPKEDFQLLWQKGNPGRTF